MTLTATFDYARTISSHLRAMRSAVELVAFEPREASEELVYSMLLWEAPRQKADAAMKRLMASVIDINELRVTREEQISAVLGKTYPHSVQRSARLTASLHELFLREHAVSLESCLAMSKRDARQYLETLEGMPPFVAARVVLVCMGAHAIPVDQRLTDALIAVDVLEQGCDIAKATGLLERHIQSGDGLDAHTLFQAWVDAGGRPLRGKGGTRGSRGGSTTKKASKSTTTSGKTRRKAASKSTTSR